MDPQDAVFIEEINFQNEVERRNVRGKILDSIWRHHPVNHRQHAEIILVTAELRTLRENFERHQAEAERDRVNYERRINEINRKLAEFEAKRDSNPILDFLGSPLAAIAAPVAAVAGGVEGGVRGTVTGFKSMVEPWFGFMTDSDNPAIVRAATMPVAVAVAVDADAVAVDADAVAVDADADAVAVDADADAVAVDADAVAVDADADADAVAVDAVDAVGGAVVGTVKGIDKAFKNLFGI
jgi:hypothetical protein